MRPRPDLRARTRRPPSAPTSRVAATTSCEAAPRVGKAVLPAGEPRGVRSDVFDEEQLSVGLQHPHDLPQGEIGCVHGAQHEGRDDRVDGSVRERQLLRRCVDQPRPEATARQPPGEAATHRGIRFDQDQLGEVVGVVRQVEAGAGADLDRAAGRPAESSSLRCLRRPACSPTHRTGSYTAAKARAQARELASGSRGVMSVSTTATMTDPALPRIARPGHLHKMARSGDRPQSKPKRAASATAAVREPRPSLWRMFATWRCTV